MASDHSSAGCWLQRGFVTAALRSSTILLQPPRGGWAGRDVTRFGVTLRWRTEWAAPSRPCLQESFLSPRSDRGSLGALLPLAFANVEEYTLRVPQVRFAILAGGKQPIARGTLVPEALLVALVRPRRRLRIFCDEHVEVVLVCLDALDFEPDVVERGSLDDSRLRVVLDPPRHDGEGDDAVGQVVHAVGAGLLEITELEYVGVELGDAVRVQCAHGEVVNVPGRPVVSVLVVDHCAASLAHLRVGQIEDVPLGIVARSADVSTMRGARGHADRRVQLLDPAKHLVDVVDLEPEVIEPRLVSRLP